MHAAIMFFTHLQNTQYMHTYTYEHIGLQTHAYASAQVRGCTHTLHARAHRCVQTQTQTLVYSLEPSTRSVPLHYGFVFSVNHNTALVKAESPGDEPQSSAILYGERGTVTVHPSEP
jgi:hypothetical protein